MDCGQHMAWHHHNTNIKCSYVTRRSLKVFSSLGTQKTATKHVLTGVLTQRRHTFVQLQFQAHFTKVLLLMRTVDQDQIASLVLEFVETLPSLILLQGICMIVYLFKLVICTVCKRM